MNIIPLMLASALLVSPALGSVLLDFQTQSNYTDYFTKASTNGTVGWKAGGYVEASGGNTPVAVRYTGKQPEDQTAFLTESVSFTFQVGAAQSGQVGIYSRIREDGGAVLAYAQFARSGSASNGSYFELRLTYGGADMVLNGSTGTSFFSGTVQYLHRYINPAQDQFTLTLNQYQEGNTAKFELVLSTVDGSFTTTTGLQTLGVSSFGQPGGVAMFLRPNTLGTIEVSSFAVVPEPGSTALALMFLGGAGLYGFFGRKITGKQAE